MQNIHYLPRGPFEQSRTQVLPFGRSASWETFMKEVMSQRGRQGNNTSGSCLAIVWEGVTFAGTYMGCVSGTLSSSGRKHSFLLCWLENLLPCAWKSLAPLVLSCVILPFTLLSFQGWGQGRNGRGRLPLVWTKHVPVLGSLTSVWRRSLGHSRLGSTLNCSEGRNRQLPTHLLSELRPLGMQ